MMARLTLILLLTASPALSAAPAPGAEPCSNSGDFSRWLTEFRAEAAAEGISQRTIDTALRGITLDPATISKDRRQGFYWQDFLMFSGRLATADRITRGQKKLKTEAALFARIDRDYGVPAPVIAAFWALESDFGLAMGKMPILRSLATLAYDCRRGPMFRTQFLDALRVIDRGDLKAGEMIGSWAGELGQMQFLPSHYFNHGVDYDGDGKRNLLSSTPDVVASTAAYLASIGWRKGEPWIEEVRVPASMAWQEADITIRKPRRAWSSLGVTTPNGKPLAADELAAALLLPMGRNGPAFLAYSNFDIYLEWNHSLNYALTAAYLARRIEGDPAMRRGNAAVPPFGINEIERLQQILLDDGYPVGKVDGKLGTNTRAAVRQAQIRLQLPADAYPTPELLRLLTDGR
ncbi:MAG: lytic murein transglycosylase [Candidatus Eisenbacteria bacterium]|nr:lytic murein transglycosylase [Candidatus Eisenbacteria bacterium]